MRCESLRFGVNVASDDVQDVLAHSHSKYKMCCFIGLSRVSCGCTRYTEQLWQ